MKVSYTNLAPAQEGTSRAERMKRWQTRLGQMSVEQIERALERGDFLPGGPLHIDYVPPKPPSALPFVVFAVLIGAAALGLLFAGMRPRVPLLLGLLGPSAALVLYAIRYWLYAEDRRAEIERAKPDFDARLRAARDDRA